MQKVFIALVLALALSSVSARYWANNDGFVKAPVTACADNNTNCSNTTTLSLAGMSASDVTLFAYNTPDAKDKNSSSLSWSIFTQKINNKDLSASSNTTYAVTAAQSAVFFYGYALAIVTENISNINQISIYQTKFDGNVAVPKYQITANTVANFTPQYVDITAAGNGKTIVFALQVAEKVVNVTAITLGGVVTGKEVNLTTNYTGGSFSIINGEALGSSQVLAVWTEGDVLKESLIDFTKGTATTGDVKDYNKANHTNCKAFSTDKKIYGALCSNYVNNTLHVYTAVLSNSSGLSELTQLSVSAVDEIFPYAGFLALTLTNSTGNTTVYKTVWDLDTKTTPVNFTQVITYEANSSFTLYRMPAGGVYGLAFNSKDATNVNSTNTDIQVGLVLGASYLTTVFGFLMTVVAGLLLF